MASRGASPDIMGGRPLPPRSGEVDSDDDGLGDHDSEVTDDEGLYEDGAETEGEGDDTSKDGPRPGRIGGRYKIQHATGDFKMQHAFLARTSELDFDAGEAIDMLQRRYTMDYGTRELGSRPARETDGYYPVFHLDMVSVIGKPLHAITSRSGFFDSVTFTLQHWFAPYSSKHAGTTLPFELRGRTFRFGAAASRELWFVVMHPMQDLMTQFEHTRDERQRKKKASRVQSAMRRDRAEALATYMVQLFQTGDLLGQGIEPSWLLGGKHSKSIPYDKWTAFQSLFAEGWDDFAAEHAYDEFWTENHPAFHTFDHGANIQIDADGPLQDLTRETRLRPDEEDDADDSSDEDDARDGEANGAGGGQHGEAGERNAEGGSPRSEEGPGGEARRSETIDAATRTALYTGGLEHLREELERKYSMSGIAQISYAIASDIHCARLGGGSQGTQEEDTTLAETLCLLADRKAIELQYGGPRDFTFYPLGFHPRYGNFSSARPPRFLQNLYSVMRDNMSFQNDGADPLDFGFFQGYSNIKRTIRSRPEALLATKAFATAALCLPPREAARNTQVKAKHQRLLASLRGGSTPQNPERSTPFARERERIEAAIEEDQLSFRMEQVVTVKVARLTRSRRDFFSVLQPIFQVMRFFLREMRSYTPVLRSFVPAVFPGILCGYARILELAMADMESRFRAGGDKGLDLALSEAVAALDRLGSFCFTGDGRVLPKRVFDVLATTESIEKGGWPYVSPEVLDMRGARGRMDSGRWPRYTDKKPLLLHIAALSFRYGAVVAAHHQSQVWFGHLGAESIGFIGAAVNFLETLFRELWVPEMVAFVTYQARRRMGAGARGGLFVSGEEALRERQLFNEALETWATTDNPFRLQLFETLFASRVDRAVDWPDLKSATRKTRYDFANELCKAALDDKGSSDASLASTHATWLPILRGAMQHTAEKVMSKGDWVEAVATAMASADIEWMPGSHRKRITSRRVIVLSGQATRRYVLTARPGSLKREAMEAEQRMALEDAPNPKRLRRAKIDFGQSIPFNTVPDMVRAGFAELDDTFAKGDQLVRRHYQAAQSCLVGTLGDPLCDLMLMLALTIASSTVTPFVAVGADVISDAPRQKNRRMLAASLVTRMLWFLRPEAFPWEQDSKGILRVSEMTKKMEQKGVNNRFLRTLGWITYTGNRTTPRTSECRLTLEEQLLSRRKSLLSARRDAAVFIGLVFNSSDKIWVERCSTIIA